ncbi:GNAT family N-acetyltransferase [Photobacterium minamisatsumaniensis]|uniref:GNAT family N-acetyltransferase n=1 Tax=Photobacterium minamisatsumaniensis TaxID=2910233 RepID=UPI003D13B96C
MELLEIEVGSIFHKQALDLRYHLFFEEMNHPRDILFDGKEKNSFHLALVKKSELVAYGRLSQHSLSEYQISQMVVNPRYQGLGYGKQVLNGLVNKAKVLKSETIFLNARLTAVSLYQSVGFIFDGEAHESPATKVEHIRMKLSLLN